MAARQRTFPWLALILIALVPILGYWVQTDSTQSLDLALSQALSLQGEAAQGAWAKLLKAITWVGHFGPRVGVALLMALIVYHWRGVTAAGLLVAIAVISSGYNSVMKAIFDRPRPDIIPHLDVVTSASYPSGHAAGAMVLYAMFAFAAPKPLRIPLLLLSGVMVVLTSISRLALGVHWASDIIGGVLGGLGFALLARPYLTANFKR